MGGNLTKIKCNKCKKNIANSKKLIIKRGLKICECDTRVCYCNPPGDNGPCMPKYFNYNQNTICNICGENKSEYDKTLCKCLYNQYFDKIVELMKLENSKLINYMNPPIKQSFGTIPIFCYGCFDCVFDDKISDYFDEHSFKGFEKTIFSKGNGIH